MHMNAKETLQEGCFSVKNHTGEASVNAYIAVTAKENADVLLSLETFDPLLISYLLNQVGIYHLILLIVLTKPMVLVKLKAFT